MKTDGTATEARESSAIAPKASSKLTSTFLAAAHGNAAEIVIDIGQELELQIIVKQTIKQYPQGVPKVHSADDAHAGGGMGEHMGGQ